MEAAHGIAELVKQAGRVWRMRRVWFRLRKVSHDADCQLFPANLQDKPRLGEIAWCRGELARAGLARRIAAEYVVSQRVVAR